MSNQETSHVAWARHRTRHRADWLEIGTGRFEKDERTGLFSAHIQLNRMPLGGFDGYVVLRPPGIIPPAESVMPQRPGEGDP
jgi:hypothetical protein